MSQNVKAELELLKSELESDLQLCTTRDQHIRVSLRLSRVSLLIQELASTAE